MMDVQIMVRATLTWIVQTLVVIGLLATVSFVRVNYFEAELQVEVPDSPKLTHRSR